MASRDRIAPHPTPWRAAIYRVIFETDTPGGLIFDLGLLVAIIISVVAVSLETVQEITEGQILVLNRIEWTLTGLFTVEYILRLVCVRRPLQYAFSFFGVIDLLSFLPTYLALSRIKGSETLFVLRTMRLLRVFRILQLSRFTDEAEVLGRAVWEARAKIVVFLTTVLIAVTIAGSGMYHVEKLNPDSHFTSIPQSIYWAIVTMTTVGYGDVVPITTGGKVVSAALILLGYGLIIVPTGFVSVELMEAKKKGKSRRTCVQCQATDHQRDAKFCQQCGAKLTLDEAGR